MITAEEKFFNILSDGIDKESQLSPEAINALGVQDPGLLDQLEEQAKNRSQVPPEPQEQPSEEMVEVAPEDEEQIPVQEPQPTLQIPNNFFKLNEIHPLKLLVVLRLRYKDKWVGLLPETLWETIRKDFGPISEVNQNKIQALSVALATDSPWQDWPIFENCGRAFNNTIPIFGQLQPLSPAETAFTVAILKKLHSFKFSDEVLGYIASVCLYNGIVFAPTKFFDKAQPVIDIQNKDIGTKGEVEAAWKALEKEDLTQVELKDDKPLDVHMVKLWAVKEYLRDKESQLKEI